MSMKEWGLQELEIYGENSKDEYGSAVLEAVKDLYLSFCDQNHSGFSAAITADIFQRLVSKKPLTAIEDFDFGTEEHNKLWNFINYNNSNGKNYNKKRDGDDKISVYQCSRMYSLFKYINHETKEVSYYNIDHAVFYDESEDDTYTTKLISDIVHQYFPIKMPYHPNGKPYRVYGKSYTIKDGDNEFDFYEVDFIISPNSLYRRNVNELFYYDEEGNTVQVVEEKLKHLLNTYIRSSDNLKHCKTSVFDITAGKVGKLVKNNPMSVDSMANELACEATNQHDICDSPSCTACNCSEEDCRCDQ